MFRALRLSAPANAIGPRAIAHIAYEMARCLRDDPEIDNATLIARVDWILQLLGREPSLLSDERQRGLIAECLLLTQILAAGRDAGIGVSSVLERWWGPAGGRRDFAASGVAIEVKSTAQNARMHHIGSLEQLTPSSPDEELYLFSIGIKTDPASSRTLPVYVADVEAQLVDSSGRTDISALESFRMKLESAGYHRDFEGVYRSGPGHQPNAALGPGVFRVSDLDILTISSFKKDQLPAMVRQVSYQLEILADPLNDQQTSALLAQLVLAPAIGYPRGGV